MGSGYGPPNLSDLAHGDIFHPADKPAAQPTIAEQADQTLQAQLAAAPQQYAAYQQYAPQYAQTDVNTLGQSLFGSSWTGGSLTDMNQLLTQQASLQSQQANTAQRTANIADVSNLGGQVYDLRQQYNPGLYSGLAQQQASAFSPYQQSAQQGQMNQMAQQGFGTFDPSSLYANTSYTNQATQAPNSYLSVGTSSSNPVLNSLARQSQGTGVDANLAQQQVLAQQAMANGGQLSPDALRAVQQSSIGNFAARGLDATNASVVDQAMQTQQAQYNRLVQNLGIGQSVESQAQSQQSLQNQLGLGTSGQMLNYGQLGLQGQVANQNAYQNLGQLGLQSQQYNQAANLQAQGLGLQAQTANQNLGLSSYAANTAAQQAQLQALQQAANLQFQQQQFQAQQQQNSISNQMGTYFDPFQGVLGQSSGNVGMNQNLMANAGNTTSGTNAMTANMFNPFSSYGQDYYNTGYNAQAGANIATSNSNAGVTAGALGAAGTIGGALLIAL